MKCTCKTKCNSCRCGIGDGERLKADAFALLADRREVVVRRAQRALLTVLLEAGSATADDVRAAVELPPGIGPKCFGAAPGTLARAGVIEADGFTRTVRPEGHARPVTVWRLANRAHALRWLADHPDLPDDDPGAGTQALLFPLNPENEPGAALVAGSTGQES